MSVDTDGFDPADYPVDLNRRAEKDPEAPTAREVHDPHSIDRDRSAILELVKPSTTAQAIAYVATLLIVGGLVYYLAPIFATVVINIYVGAGLVVLLILGSIYLKGRIDGINRIRHFDKSIVYYGDEIDVRVGYEGEEEGREKTFLPLEDIGFAGLWPKKLRKESLPYDSSRLLSKRQDSQDPDSEPVVDRLNRATAEAYTDQLGYVMVTHAANLEGEPQGRNTDRYTTPPAVIDEDVADDFRLQHKELATHARQLEQQIMLLKQKNAELGDLRESQTSPQFEQLMSSLEDLLEMVGHTRPQKSRRDRSRPPLDQRRAESLLNGDFNE